VHYIRISPSWHRTPPRDAWSYFICS
jgi:hypothetical protein